VACPSTATADTSKRVADVFFLVCDGLKGLPQSVNAVFADTIVQSLHHPPDPRDVPLCRPPHRDVIARPIKPIYTAINAAAAKEALDAFDAAGGQRYPTAIRLWRNAWEEFIPFLDYEPTANPLPQGPATGVSTDTNRGVVCWPML
jgi:putative transposase